MNNKLNVLAAALAMSMPAVGSNIEVRPARNPGLGDWFRRNAGSRRTSRRTQRDASRLQLRGWPTAPCDAPEGYFWHQAKGGKRLHYLLKSPPIYGNKHYDEANDRTIIVSGWGYVKPTYAPGDVR